MKVIYRSHAEKVLRDEIKEWATERRRAVRPSPFYDCCRAAELALKSALRRIRELEAINARLA